MTGSNSISNNNQLWYFNCTSMDLYFIMMMDMNWSNNTINLSSRNSIWNSYHINMIKLVDIRVLLQNRR